MSVFTSTYDFDISSDANFQALMGAIDDQLVSFGWSLTADTGQTDPGAASAPSSSAFAGYRVYQTNDAGTVYYVKIQYGRSAGNAPRWKIDVGSGTNGTGTITGQTSTQLDIESWLSSGTHRLYMSGTTGRAMFSTGADNGTAANHSNFSVGRTCDGAGADTNQGIEIFASLGGSVAKAQLIPFSGTVGVQEPIWPCAFTSRDPAVQGTVTMIGIPVLSCQSLVASPTRLVAIWDTTSFTTNTTTTVTHYSASHTYLVTLAGAVFTVSGSLGRAMLLYE